MTPKKLAAMTVPSVRQLHDSRLHSMFHQHKAALPAKIESVVDETSDATGKPCVNVLFGCYDADHNIKAINLFDVASVKTVNNMSMSSVVSAALNNYGKCRNDVVALCGSFTEYTRCAVG